MDNPEKLATSIYIFITLCIYAYTPIISALYACVWRIRSNLNERVDPQLLFIKLSKHNIKLNNMYIVHKLELCYINIIFCVSHGGIFFSNTLILTSIRRGIAKLNNLIWFTWEIWFKCLFNEHISITDTCWRNDTHIKHDIVIHSKVIAHFFTGKFTLFTNCSSFVWVLQS
jgi:hypothetical protein